ncbi:MAG TPA: hypothetical protein DD384_03280 [Firmicutes bacterium]|nr:hypothetical protein [Bacillota bacterium]
MSFSVTYGDALEYKGDAVLNSLGTNGAVYGRLCKNIIKGINRKDVKTLIDAQKDMPFGKIIETEGGDLQSAHVLHIVTPFKKNDDSNCTQLRKAYKSVVDYAINRGYKTIGLPIIGTGANGYSDKESYEAVLDVLSEISDKEVETGEDIINATVIAYLNPKPLKEQLYEDERRMLLERARNAQVVYDSCALADKVAPYNSKLNEAYADKHSFLNVIRFVADINPEDMFFPDFWPNPNSYQYPYDFIDDYCAQKDINHKKVLKEYDCRKRQKVRYNQTLSKIDVFRFSVLLNLTKTEIIQFMSLCGYGFNPGSRLDMFFMDFINGKYGKFGKQRKLYEMDMLFMPRKGEVQFTV